MTSLVLSPDAVIRFKGGQAVIHNPHSPEPALQTDDGLTIAFIARFAAPLEFQAAMRLVPPAARAAAAELIQRLEHAQVLIPAIDAAPPADAAADVRTAVRGLQALADSVHELAADVLALGPAAPIGISATGVGLAQRVYAMLAAVDGLRDTLSTVRREVTATQLATIQDRVGAEPLRLHIGSGGHVIEGWVNVDVAPADLTINLSRGLPFKDRSVHLIYAAHVLEHLFYPRQAVDFLKECCRILKPGGRLRIAVPDIEQAIRAYCADDREYFNERRRQWPSWPQDRTPLEDFLAYAGAGAQPGDFIESHKYGYDYATLSRLASLVGFASVERSGYLQSPLPELRVDGASSVAGAHHGDAHYSLFVEAVA